MNIPIRQPDPGLRPLPTPPASSGKVAKPTVQAAASTNGRVKTWDQNTDVTAKRITQIYGQNVRYSYDSEGRRTLSLTNLTRVDRKEAERKAQDEVRKARPDSQRPVSERSTPQERLARRRETQPQPREEITRQEVKSSENGVREISKGFGQTLSNLISKVMKLPTVAALIAAITNFKLKTRSAAIEKQPGLDKQALAERNEFIRKIAYPKSGKAFGLTKNQMAEGALRLDHARTDPYSGFFIDGNLPKEDNRETIKYLLRFEPPGKSHIYEENGEYWLGIKQTDTDFVFLNLTLASPQDFEKILTAGILRGEIASNPGAYIPKPT